MAAMAARLSCGVILLLANFRTWSLLQLHSSWCTPSSQTTLGSALHVQSAQMLQPHSSSNTDVRVHNLLGSLLRSQLGAFCASSEIQGLKTPRSALARLDAHVMNLLCEQSDLVPC